MLRLKPNTYDSILDSLITLNDYYRQVINDDKIRQSYRKAIKNEDSHIVRGSIAARTKDIINEEEDIILKAKASKINREVMLSWK